MKIKDITLAINKALAFSLDESVLFYVNKVPKDFERPSVFIKFVKIKTERSTVSQIKKEMYFTVTYFGTTDEYHNTDKLGLYDVLDVIIDTFSAEVLCVNDRNINIKSSFGGENDGEIYVDLAVNFVSDVSLDIIDDAKYENMEELYLN